ncbi:MAG: hypothetical protein HQL01_02180, partial [Nitrospirae bacterium]|nr:hypothetical protein [Nitrospirota bacterium]
MRKTILLSALTLLIFHTLALFCGSPQAGLIDRVCAFVDNDAITLGEFQEVYTQTKAKVPSITKEEVLTTMINRILLKRAALAMKISGTDEDQIIAEYIDLKVRSYVIIKEEEIEGFYNENKKEFAGAGIGDVRAE